MAADQYGHFTVAQAREAGVSPKTLQKMKERGELRRPGMVPPEGQAAVAAALISTGSPQSGEAAWPLVLRPPLSPVQRPAERTLPGVARRRGTRRA